MVVIYPSYPSSVIQDSGTFKFFSYVNLEVSLVLILIKTWTQSINKIIYYSREGLFTQD